MVLQKNENMVGESGIVSNLCVTIICGDMAIYSDKIVYLLSFFSYAFKLLPYHIA